MYIDHALTSALSARREREISIPLTQNNHSTALYISLNRKHLPVSCFMNLMFILLVCYWFIFLGKRGLLYQVRPMAKATAGTIAVLCPVIFFGVTVIVL